MTSEPSLGNSKTTAAGANGKSESASAKNQSSFLKEIDPELFAAIGRETERQKSGLEMIASENYTSLAVMEAQGSTLTNKYAEGYPHKRYYGGCQFVDEVESMAIERAKKLFSCSFANVQPHSGSQANMAVYLATLSAGDRVLGLDLAHGGHLTHGSPVNFSGLLFHAHSYKLDPQSGLINYDQIRNQALEVRPQMIIAGYSAYPRLLDFGKFREIADEVGATLLVDMAHFAGLVAGGVHPSPVGVADFVTTTTHKTLRGPRGGLILTNSEERSKKMNSRIFPGIQGGPLEHVIAGKAVAFKEALDPSFKIYAAKIIENAKVLGETLKSAGFDLVTGGTDNHLLLVDLSETPVTGKAAEEALDLAGITVNKNTVPHEKRSPFVTSGIRVGTPALTTRGMGVSEMRTIGGWMAQILKEPEDLNLRAKIRSQVRDLCKNFPIYPEL